MIEIKIWVKISHKRIQNNKRDTSIHTFHTLITTNFLFFFFTFCPLKKLPTLSKHTSFFKCLPAFLLSSPPKPNKTHTFSLCTCCNLLRGRAASLVLIRPHYFTLFFRFRCQTNAYCAITTSFPVSDNRGAAITQKQPRDQQTDPHH